MTRPSPLDALELGDGREAEDDEERPGTHLRQRDGVPSLKDKKAAVQGSILMGALAVIVMSILLRPKLPLNPAADSFTSLGALFPLTPGVQAHG